jgi:hypothetical protein
MDIEEWPITSLPCLLDPTIENAPLDALLMGTYRSRLSFPFYE